MNNIGSLELYKKLNAIYDANKVKTVTEVYDSFKQIPIDINEEYDKLEKAKKHYSNENYLLCTPEEQQQFKNDQLQFIECMVAQSIYDKTGMTWSWDQIIDLISNPAYKNVEKIKRKVMYSVSGTNRPIGEQAYGVWNGFQAIDLDIKDEAAANALKPIIFEELKKYEWFLGVYKSASGKSLHVWTKIIPTSVTPQNKKVEFLANFRHKFSYVYIVLLSKISKFGYTKEQLISFMDMAMAKPQQGVFISADSDFYMNTNFIDSRFDKNFQTAYTNGVVSIDWIKQDDLQKVFSKLDWFSNDKFSEETNITMDSITNISGFDKEKSKGKRHYKHAQRWQLANTLNSLFGYDEALRIMIEICDGTSISELKGDVKTASIHNKPMTTWAIYELNKNHGFDIKVDGNASYVEEQIKKLEGNDNSSTEDDSCDPVKVLTTNDNHKVVFNIKHNQYLSDIKDDIISNLSHITLLEAGAGYGKTEMIKAFKAKTLLILPYTSTIKAKVEVSETTKDWLYFYGTKRPTLDDIFGDKNMAMTIDKFSRLNVMELDQGNFEYIVIDESHLLFTSMYRDVMAPTIQRLANCRAKVIMMTGTPTGELLFFPNIKHIKVYKEDLRIKKFELHMCPTTIEQTIEMSKMMAQDIRDGIKILFPTNKGNLYFEQITGLIQQYLDIFKVNKKLKSFYYKKSNTGDESMDDINFGKTIGDNDIIFCTTYLSVGVDICDKYKFSVYFNETWIPQDIEQFANRLRNNDLYLKLFLPKKNSQGDEINYYNTQKLDLSSDDASLLFMRDMLQTCNDFLERNQEEAKYSPLIRYIMQQNKYLKFDENEAKYYVDETTYKLTLFEERYKEYSKQLKILLSSIKYYGYDVEVIDHKEEVHEDKIEQVQEFLKSCRHIRYDYIKNETFTFLDQINDSNIDIYKEVLNGSYEIFKHDKFETDTNNNGLYVKDIEIVERNLPIILGLYRFYDCDTIKDIFKYCVDVKQNRINYTKLKRINKFVSIVSSIRKSKMDIPILKYIVEARKFAIEHPEIELGEVKKWIGVFAAKFANSVKNVVVEDINYLEKTYEILDDLWKVIIIQGRAKNGIVSISPFDLSNWEEKTTLNDIYGGSKMTKEFFLQDLVEDMKDKEEEDIPLDIDLPELEHTEKKQLKDVHDDLKNVIHSSFSYDQYSKEDGSNDRFIKKQENTNSLNDTLFNNNVSEAPEVEKNNGQLELFDDNLPF